MNRAIVFAPKHEENHIQEFFILGMIRSQKKMKMQQVTKNDIDDFFIKNHNKLIKNIDQVLRNLKQKNYMDAQTYLSEAYIYVIDRAHKIPSIKDLPGWVYRVWLTQIRWNGNTTLNKKNKINNNNNDDYYYYFDIIDKFNLNKQEDEENDFNDYILRISAIEIYKQTCGKENQIVFDAYFKEGNNSVRKLKDRLKIKHSASHNYIKHFKSEIQKIYENLKKEL